MGEEKENKVQEEDEKARRGTKKRRGEEKEGGERGRGGGGGGGGGVDQYNICCPIYKGQRLLEDSGEGGRMESLLAICLLSLFHPILKLSDGVI